MSRINPNCPTCHGEGVIHRSPPVDDLCPDCSGAEPAAMEPERRETACVVCGAPCQSPDRICDVCRETRPKRHLYLALMEAGLPREHYREAAEAEIIPQDQLCIMCGARLDALERGGNVCNECLDSHTRDEIRQAKREAGIN